MTLELREGRHLCPAHTDQHPSLDIARGRDGRWLLYCRAGCPTKAVLQAVGLTWSDLFRDSEITHRPLPRRRRSPLAEARLEILREARRGRWNRPGVREMYVIADFIRTRFVVADRLRRAVTAAGDTPVAWEAAVQAAALERDALWTEHALEWALS